MPKQLDVLISSTPAPRRRRTPRPEVDGSEPSCRRYTLTRPAVTKLIVADILSPDLWRLHDQKPGLSYLLPGDYDALTCLVTVDGSWQLTLWPETA